MSKATVYINNFKEEWKVTSVGRKTIWVMLLTLQMAIFIPAIVFALKFGSTLNYQYSTYALLLAMLGYAVSNIKVIKPKYQS